MRTPRASIIAGCPLWPNSSVIDTWRCEKQVLTDPVEFITNGQLKTLSLELLALIPMSGIERRPLDSGVIMEIVFRAAVRTTPINGVTTHTDEMPNREPAMISPMLTVIFILSASDLIPQHYSNVNYIGIYGSS